jgi:hypothetical protein
MRSINGFETFVHCFGSHELATNSSIVNCSLIFLSCMFMKQIPICSRAFFNPYFFLYLDEFGCDSIIHPFTSLVNSSTSCCHFPLSLYSIICSSIFIFYFSTYDCHVVTSLDVMVSRFEHGEGTNHEYPIKELILKSGFFIS